MPPEPPLRSTSGTATGASPRETLVAKTATLRGSAPATALADCSEVRQTTVTRSLAWVAASGVLGGLATLMRPDWLLFVPFVAVAGLFLTRHRVKHLLASDRHVAGSGRGDGAVVVAKSAGGVRVFPTTLQVGASLYDGLNPRANGESDMWFVPQFAADQRQRAGKEGV